MLKPRKKTDRDRRSDSYLGDARSSCPSPFSRAARLPISALRGPISAGKPRGTASDPTFEKCSRRRAKPVRPRINPPCVFVLVFVNLFLCYPSGNGTKDVPCEASNHPSSHPVRVHPLEWKSLKNRQGRTSARCRRSAAPRNPQRSSIRLSSPRDAPMRFLDDFCCAKGDMASGVQLTRGLRC